jgi:hypothetical protein
MRKIFLAGFVLSMVWSASAQALSFNLTDIRAGGSAVVVADFNNDGIPDIATLSFSSGGTVAILLGKGDGTFQTPRDAPGQGTPSGFLVSDFNLDENIDLVVNWVDNSGKYAAYILLGKGDGTFRSPIYQSVHMYRSSAISTEMVSQTSS